MKAIDERFAQAEKAFGGQLPEICQKTREEINKKDERVEKRGGERLKF